MLGIFDCGVPVTDFPNDTTADKCEKNSGNATYDLYPSPRSLKNPNGAFCLYYVSVADSCGKLLGYLCRDEIV